VKKIVLSALVLAAAAGAANAQSITFRVAERFGTTTVSPSGSTATGNSTGVVGDNRIGITVYGRLNSANNAALLGIGGYAFSVITNDTGVGGNFVTAASSQDPTRQRNAALANAGNGPGYTTFADTNGDPAPSGFGVYNPYRVVANLGDLASGSRGLSGGNNTLQEIVGATGPDQFASVAAGFASAGQFGLNTEIPLFTFMYDVSSFAARILTFRITGEAGSFVGFATGAPIAGPTSATFSEIYSVNVIPAPGAAALLGLGGLLVARRRRA